MTILLKNLSQIKDMLLIGSKVIFICMSLYYLYDASSYGISFNLPLGLRQFYIINKILGCFESIGLMLLIIPMVVVVMSFYDDARWLKILSGIFALSGTVFSLFYGISQGLLEDRFKAGVLTIFHEVKLADKEKVFQIILDRQIHSKISGILDLSNYQTFVQSAISREWPLFIEKLKHMTMESIESFANVTAHNIYMRYLEQLSRNSVAITDSNTWSLWNIISPKTLFIMSGVLIIGGLAYYLYYKIQQGAVLIRDETKEQTITVKREKETGVNEMMHREESITYTKNLKDSLTAAWTKINELIETSNVNANSSTQISERMLILEKKLQDVISQRGNAPIKSSEAWSTNEIFSIIEELTQNVDHRFGNVENTVVSKLDEALSRLDKLELRVESGEILHKPISVEGQAAIDRLVNQTNEKLLNFNPTEISSQIKRETMASLDIYKTKMEGELNEVVEGKQQLIDRLGRKVNKTTETTNELTRDLKVVKDQMQTNNHNVYTHLEAVQKDVRNLQHDHTMFKQEVATKLHDLTEQFSSFKNLVIARLPKLPEKQVFTNLPLLFAPTFLNPRRHTPSLSTATDDISLVPQNSTINRTPSVKLEPESDQELSDSGDDMDEGVGPKIKNYDPVISDYPHSDDDTSN